MLEGRKAAAAPKTLSARTSFILFFNVCNRKIVVNTCEATSHCKTNVVLEAVVANTELRHNDPQNPPSERDHIIISPDNDDACGQEMMT